jgi:hypothetical protein
MVCFFLNTKPYSWNVDKVFSFFTEEMAAVILQIPLSRHGGDDFIAWSADKSGIY